MKNRIIEVKWALIFVGATLLWMVLEKAVGLHGEHIDKHPTYTNLLAIVAIAVYVFALLDKRKNHYGGTMTYMQGFISGLVITVIVAALSPLTQYLVSNIITPEYFPNAIAHAVENDLMTQEAAEQYFTLSNYRLQGVVGALVLGVVTSAVVAIFVRKK